MDFSESRFNTEVRYGTVGGPEFNTGVLTTTAGVEQRNSNRLDAYGSWEIGGDTYDRSEIDWLTAFFRERKGREGGFRFKDWSDCDVTVAQGFLLPIQGVTGQLQMIKRYTSGSNHTDRAINKPVPGTIQFFHSGTPVSLSIDYTTGVVQLAGDGTGYTWSGEFDVPVRFTADTFSSTFEAYRASDQESLFTISGLGVKEIPVVAIPSSFEFTPLTSTVLGVVIAQPPVLTAPTPTPTPPTETPPSTPPVYVPPPPPPAPPGGVPPGTLDFDGISANWLTQQVRLSVASFVPDDTGATLGTQYFRLIYQGRTPHGFTVGDYVVKKNLTDTFTCPLRYITHNDASGFPYEYILDASAPNLQTTLGPLGDTFDVPPDHADATVYNKFVSDNRIREVGTWQNTAGRSTYTIYTYTIYGKYVVTNWGEKLELESMDETHINFLDGRSTSYRRNSAAPTGVDDYNRLGFCPQDMRIILADRYTSSDYDITDPNNALGPWRYLCRHPVYGNYQGLVYNPTDDHLWTIGGDYEDFAIGGTSSNGAYIEQRVIYRMDPAVGRWVGATYGSSNTPSVLQNGWYKRVSHAFISPEGNMAVIFQGISGITTHYYEREDAPVSGTGSFFGNRGGGFYEDLSFTIPDILDFMFSVGAVVGNKVYFPTINKLINYTSRASEAMPAMPTAITRFGDFWTDPASEPPYFKSPAVAACGTKVYVMGSGEDTKIFDTIAGTWSTGAAHPLGDLNMSRGIAVGTKIYVFGGRIGENGQGYDLNTNDFIDDVFCYDTVANTWTRKAPIPQMTSFFSYTDWVRMERGGKSQGRSTFGLAASPAGKIYLTCGGPYKTKGPTSYQYSPPPNPAAIPDAMSEPFAVYMKAVPQFLSMCFEYDPSLDV